MRNEADARYTGSASCVIAQIAHVSLYCRKHVPSIMQKTSPRASFRLAGRVKLAKTGMRLGMTCEQPAKTFCRTRVADDEGAVGVLSEIEAPEWSVLARKEKLKPREETLFVEKHES